MVTPAAHPGEHKGPTTASGNGLFSIKAGVIGMGGVRVRSRPKSGRTFIFKHHGVASFYSSGAGAKPRAGVVHFVDFTHNVRFTAKSTAVVSRAGGRLGLRRRVSGRSIVIRSAVAGRCGSLGIFHSWRLGLPAVVDIKANSQQNKHSHNNVQNFIRHIVWFNNRVLATNGSH